MPELLIELFSEEIPARMQARAGEDLKRIVTDKLKEAGLAVTEANAYATPRRLTLVVDGIPLAQPDIPDEKRGPRVGAPDQAVQGFLKSAGLTSLDQCEKRDTGKGEFWFAVTRKRGRPTAHVLVDVLHSAIGALAWPKSMRWASYDLRWVRPLHNILVILDGSTVEFGLDRIGSDVYFDPDEQTFEDSYTPDYVEKFGTLIANNQTVGHRFLDPRKITVSGFTDYKVKLRESFVIVDPAERRTAIRTQADKLAATEGLTVKPDEALLEEVTGLVEWPVVLMGRIEQQFMEIPPEVLTTSMRVNQKYFSLIENSGRLAPRFLVVANTETKDKGSAIVAGNERVLRARLADAKFFWDQDRKLRLEARVPALNDIIFHARLGSVADKVARVQKLATELAPRIRGADAEQVGRAALLAKADLTTGMVGEFPELQGVMGRYYAMQDGEKQAVADAIAEHYAPLGPTDRCPTAPVSVAVALADKMYSLVGFFAIGEKPTGSKDPFALRRAALGAIRLIIENRLRIGLQHMFLAAHRLFESPQIAGAVEGAIQYDTAEVERYGGKDFPVRTGMAPLTALRDPHLVSQELLDFFADRLKVALREKGLRHDLISAVFALGGEDDLVRLLTRVDALRTFLESEDGANLLVAYRRASNIVRIEEKKDGKTYNSGVDAALLRQGEEKALHSALTTSGQAGGRALDSEDFGGAMAALAQLRRPVDAFFDNVTVNCEEADLRANRLRLLSEIRSTLNRVADFSQIEG
jgi:glycyl-tRNA synthetase beta chain